jgi:uncharacterized protein YjiS (DUF1127 family)
MTARLFGFDAPLTALFTAVDNGVRVLVRGNGLARSLACRTTGNRRRAAGGRQLAYLDDRMLSDIGLRRDELPSAARDRLQDRIMRFHI